MKQWLLIFSLFLCGLANGTLPQAVRSVGGSLYAYDANGNMTVRGNRHLYYDASNRLGLVSSNSQAIASFGYDGNSSRLWKQSGTNLQVWIGPLYEEKQGKTLVHVLAGDRLVCTFDSTGTNVFEYYQSDHLRSSSILTDQTGNRIQHHEYSAFGRDRFTESSTAFPVTRRYTGQPLDDETGLYYYGFRYYDPQLARFIQPDTITSDLFNPQSWNRYSYTHNNPLRYTDPSGHEPEDEDVPLRAGGVRTMLRSGDAGAQRRRRHIIPEP